MSTSEISLPRKSHQYKLDLLFHSRLRIALFALILQTLIMIPMIRSFLFIVGIFNIPALLALVACTLENKLLNYQVQKTIKILLKVGIAKAVGGVLLALYIGLKYAYMSNEMEHHNSRAVMRFCAIYLGGSALVDVLYSLFAFAAIARTKDIIKILRRERSKMRLFFGKTRSVSSSSSEGSASGSVSSAEEDNSDKVSQNNF
jgi:hypothetical protein